MTSYLKLCQWLNAVSINIGMVWYITYVGMLRTRNLNHITLDHSDSTTQAHHDRDTVRQFFKCRAFGCIMYSWTWDDDRTWRAHSERGGGEADRSSDFQLIRAEYVCTYTRLSHLWSWGNAGYWRPDRKKPGRSSSNGSDEMRTLACGL